MRLEANGGIGWHGALIFRLDVIQGIVVVVVVVVVLLSCTHPFEIVFL